MEKASIQSLVSSAEAAHHMPLRSGHAPELPLDLIGFESNFPVPFPSANDSLLDEIVNTEDVHLQSALARGYEIGLKEGNRNLRSWCAASLIGGAVILFLLAGAFPEAASMVIRQQPAPLESAALASLNATSR